jgi:hypothetical protein
MVRYSNHEAQTRRELSRAEAYLGSTLERLRLAAEMIPVAIERSYPERLLRAG